MSNIPRGFDKPPRQWNLKWLAFPGLVLAIFAFIMIRVQAASDKRHRQEQFDDLVAAQYRMRLSEPDPLQGISRQVSVPGADQDRVVDLPGGLVERHFAGIVMHHPASWVGQPTDNALGRSIAMRAGGSAISVLVVTGMTPEEAMSGVAAAVTVQGPTERIIAGEKRTGKKGITTAMGLDLPTEVFAFELGGYTIAVLLQYEAASARQAEADLAALTVLKVAT